MNKEWYVDRDGTREGPFTLAELHKMAENRMLMPKDYIIGNNINKWTRADNIEGLFDAPPPPPDRTDKAFLQPPPLPGKGKKLFAVFAAILILILGSSIFYIVSTRNITDVNEAKLNNLNNSQQQPGIIPENDLPIPDEKEPITEHETPFNPETSIIGAWHSGSYSEDVYLKFLPDGTILNMSIIDDEDYGLDILRDTRSYRISEKDRNLMLDLFDEYAQEWFSFATISFPDENTISMVEEDFPDYPPYVYQRVDEAQFNQYWQQ